MWFSGYQPLRNSTNLRLDFWVLFGLLMLGRKKHREGISTQHACAGEQLHARLLRSIDHGLVLSELLARHYRRYE